MADWHRTALDMAAAGATKYRIAKTVGRSYTAVRQFLVPGVLEQHRLSRDATGRRRWAEDPAYRAQRLEQQRQRHRERSLNDPVYRERERLRMRRKYMRKLAREEAAASGRSYESICTAWEIDP